MHLGSAVAPKMKGTFYSKPNIRMRDIWKTSKELEHQGSSELICFAPGHGKKPLVFPLCRSTQGKNKGESLVFKDPFFLLIRNMQLALWEVIFKDLSSSLIQNLMKVYKWLEQNRNKSSLKPISRECWPSHSVATLSIWEHPWFLPKWGCAVNKVERAHRLTFSGGLSHSLSMSSL